MAERLTDKFNKLFSILVTGIANFTKAGAGLPISTVNTIAVAPTSSTTLTITMATDAWIAGIYPTVLTTAGAQVQDAWVDRIDITGFRIWDMQGALGPIYGPSPTVLPKTGQQFSGYARPFPVRQGDVISVTFTSLNAAALRGTVFVDAYRADDLGPG
jgi:hypothetical protein